MESNQGVSRKHLYKKPEHLTEQKTTDRTQASREVSASAECNDRYTCVEWKSRSTQ